MSIQEPRRGSTPVGTTDVDAGSTAIVCGTPRDGVLRRRRRWVRRTALWILATVVVVALVAGGLVVWTVRRSFPDYGGTIALPGLSAPVTVYRDAYGIPQIFARSETDLFKAQGYVTAQDRFWEMDFHRHLTSGRLSEMFGDRQLSNDMFVRTLGWRRVAALEWQLLSPPAKSYLQAYAAGINAWIAGNGGSNASGAKSLEYTILGLTNSGYTVQPWDPIDSIAWLKAMAWDLRGNMSAETERATLLAEGLTREQIGELYPPYPYDRHQPIVQGGAVVGGAFEADNGAVPASASSAGPDRRVTGAVWRQAAPALGSVSRAMQSLTGSAALDGTGIGSNSWVVSGALTRSGKPLLANDPHLRQSIPGVWYQLGLHCTCSFNIEGFSLPGIPGVVIGHNGRIAWGLTNLGPDVTDLYLEKVKGDRYFDGTTWRPLETRQEVIDVAGGRPVSITVRATKHGPLLSDRSADLLGIAARPPVDRFGSPLPSLIPAPTPKLDPAAPGVPAVAASTSYAVALRWTALDPGRTIEALFALDKAADWEHFRAAAALFDAPAQNIVYADVDGNIGYQAPGQIPVRGKGDGMWPAPGWDPAYDWKGYIPFADLPNELNPLSGIIVTANQAAVGPQYPYIITQDWDYGYRSQRILDLIKQRTTGGGKLSVADTRQIQFDNYNSFAPVLVPALLAAPLGADANAVATARDLLNGWDFQQPAEAPAGESAAAAFYNATWRHLLLRVFDKLPAGHRPSGDSRWWEVVRPLLATPTSPWWDDPATPATESMNDILVAAMRDAVTELTGWLGADPAGWRWGDLHTLTLASDTFGHSGIASLEWLFNRGPVRSAGGGGLVNATSWSADEGYEIYFVPSMRVIADMSDLDSSRWVQLPGNSGHAFHANYDDQVELWRTGHDTPMRWSRSSIESAAKHTLTMEPVA